MKLFFSLNFCLLMVSQFLAAQDPQKYYSQFKQDEYLNTHVFKNKTNGVFVDIGAHDGITFNNSYFFEKNLNWRGICIEPMANVFEKLVRNRHCACIKGCITKLRETAKFLKIDSRYVDIQMLSGLIKKYDPQHLERVKHDLKKYGGTFELTDVECYRLEDILVMHGITHIDYLSVDTEGGELEILESIDFSKISVEIIDVENNYEDSKIRNILAQNGYEFITRIVCDDIYKKVH